MKMLIFINLWVKNYFSLAKNSDIFIGNSSGDFRSTFFKIPVINIGKKAAGRYIVKVSNISPITKIIREIDKILNQKEKIPPIRYQKNVSSFIIKNILKKLRDKIIPIYQIKYLTI